MNILETTTVKIDSDFFFTFQDSDLKIAVPKRYYSVVSDGFRCKMGVRPMDVLVGGADSQGTPEKITTFENLGDERRIGISVGESLLMLITLTRPAITPVTSSSWRSGATRPTCSTWRPARASKRSKEQVL